MRESFSALNINSELLHELTKESIITAGADADLKAINVEQGRADGRAGTVEFNGEEHHGKDHAAHVGSLIGRLETGKIGKDTVIAIELKNYGENLGMSDVILLANIIKHNEKNPDNQLIMPKKIEQNSLIYQDALLYNAARDKGVQVIGLEGKGLHTAEAKAEKNYKGSDRYNELRDKHMAGVINDLTGKGYNVIAYVGSAHVEPLQKLIKKIVKDPTVIRNFSEEHKQKFAAVLAELKHHRMKVHAGTEIHSAKNPKPQSHSTNTGHGGRE